MLEPAPVRIRGGGETAEARTEESSHEETHFVRVLAYRRNSLLQDGEGRFLYLVGLQNRLIAYSDHHVPT
jgi:hypothetical protein